MRKISALSVIAAALALSGCGKYSSDYDAVGFVHSNLSESAFMNFYKLDGTVVFSFDPDKAGSLEYSGSLEQGSMKISIDKDGTKEDLFSLSSGGETENSIAVPAGETVYVIIETDGGCENGSLEFEIK